MRDDTMFALGTAFGLSLPYALSVPVIVCRAIYWATYDTIYLFRDGVLEPGVNRANWLLIVPRMFARYLWRELCSGFHGARRIA